MTKKILVAEGDRANGKLLLDYLESENYLVTSVDNANDALNNIENENYDLMIVDVKLLGKYTRLELLTMIEKDKTLPAIVTSVDERDKSYIPSKEEYSKPLKFLTKYYDIFTSSRD